MPNKILKIEKLVKLDDKVLFNSLDNRKYTVKFTDGVTTTARGSAIYIAMLYLRASYTYECVDPGSSRYSILDLLKGKVYSQDVLEAGINGVVNGIGYNNSIRASEIVSKLYNSNYNRLIYIGDRYQVFPTLMDTLQLADNDELCAIRDNFKADVANEAKYTRQAKDVLKKTRGVVGRMLKVGAVNLNQLVDNVFAKGTLTQADGTRFRYPITDPLLDMRESADVIMSMADHQVASTAHTSELGPMNWKIKSLYTVSAAVSNLINETCSATRKNALHIIPKDDDLERLHGSHAWVAGKDGYIYQCLDKNDSTLIGKNMFVRTAVSCQHEDGVCRECLGTLSDTYTKGNLAVSLLTNILDSLFNRVMKTKHNLRHRIAAALGRLKSKLLHWTPKGYMYNDDCDRVEIEIPANLMPMIPDLDLVDDVSTVSGDICLTGARIYGYDSKGNIVGEEFIEDQPGPFTLASTVLEYIKDFPEDCKLVGDNYIIRIHGDNWDNDKRILGNMPVRQLAPAAIMEDWMTLMNATSGTTTPTSSGVIPDDDLLVRLMQIYQTSKVDIFAGSKLAHQALMLRARTMAVDEYGNVVDARPRPHGTPGLIMVNRHMVEAYRGSEIQFHIGNRSLRWLNSANKFTTATLNLPNVNLDYLTKAFNINPPTKDMK